MSARAKLTRAMRCAMACLAIAATASHAPIDALPAPMRRSRARTPDAVAGLDPILGDLLRFHPTWITRLQSSHDRTGGNRDNDTDGVPIDQGRRVLFQATGEGRITRLWMTANSDTEVPSDYGELWIETDGHTVFRGNPLDFFNGRAAAKSPLVLGFMDSSGGLLSMLPLPYQHDARILFRGDPHFYQVGYRTGVGASSGPDEAQIAHFLQDDWALDAPLMRSVVRAGPPTVLARGPALVSDLSLEVDPAALPRLTVRIAGGAPFPLSFLFGFTLSASDSANAPEWPAVRDVLHRSDPARHRLETRLPIPLQFDETIELAIDGEDSDVGVSVALSPKGILSTGVRTRTDFRTHPAPTTDTTFPVFEATSTAVTLVSTVMEIVDTAPGTRAFLEGDEMIRLDGMEQPLLLGTGTEDYFNGGWYFKGVHTNPISGLTRLRVTHPENGWRDATFEYSMYRLHPLDPIVARAGMRFGFEGGELGSFEGSSYRTLAIAYEFPLFREHQHVVFEVDDGQGDAVISALDAEHAQLPRAFRVRRGPGTTRLRVPCRSQDALAGMLLVRTFDAARSRQGAFVGVGRDTVGSFFELAANTYRRFAQDELYVELTPDDCVDGAIDVSIQALHGRPWSEGAYEARLFADE